MLRVLVLWIRLSDLQELTKIIPFDVSLRQYDAFVST